MTISKYEQDIRTSEYEVQISRQRIEKAERNLRLLATGDYPGIAPMDSEKIAEQVSFWAKELSDQTDTVDKILSRIDRYNAALDRLLQAW